MKVKDLMTTDLITIGRESPLKEAARRMIEAGVSGLPVTDAARNLEGVITEADFVKTESGRRVVAPGFSNGSATARRKSRALSAWSRT